MKPATRLFAEHHSFSIGADAASAGHPVTVTIGRDRAGQVVEIAIVEAGKMGHGLQLLLSELGLRISRCLQDRDPETGRDLTAPREAL